jgi:cytosine/adenosine deaminase-related metal-dependent hydrolase
MIRTIHRAKFVAAEADLVLTNAAVHVAAPGRISRIEPWHGTRANLESRLIDWGDAVILPGLVNAHSHLELTGLGGRITAFTSFADWLRQLVRLRREWTPEDYMASAHRGARDCLVSGTTLVGDISASGQSLPALRCRRLRSVVFEETLGLAPERAVPAVAEIERRVQKPLPNALGLSGVSPHAPYTVSGELYRLASRFARELQIPIATHVAESSEELEFLGSGQGAMRDFLSEVGALPSGWTPPGLHPVEYLDSLEVLESSPLLSHCNYLDPDAISRIQKSRCSIVYCPRSHAYFGHTAHPVRQLLDSGINVALGTDSLASNSSLSVLDEMRYVFEARKDLKTEEILRMATLNGASALGFGGVLGRLRRGYWADMTILALPPEVTERRLVAEILEGAGECRATVVRGEAAHVAEGFELPMTRGLSS